MRWSPLTRRLRSDDGFSLIDALVVIALISIIGAMAVLAMPSWIREARADSEMARVIAELRRAKEMATSQRRDIEVRFVGTNEVRLLRQEVPITANPTLLSSVSLEGGAVFQNFPGLVPGPDGFKNVSALDFGGSTVFIFRAEGTFTDANANLDPISGTVYLGISNDPMSARAVTILGTTGIIRGFRWDGAHWVE